MLKCARIIINLYISSSLRFWKEVQKLTVVSGWSELSQAPWVAPQSIFVVERSSTVCMDSSYLRIACHKLTGIDSEACLLPWDCHATDKSTVVAGSYQKT